MSSKTPPKDLTNGKMRFVQHFLPPLEAGDYQLTLSQSVSSKTGIAEETYKPSKPTKFAVLGPHFTLLPTTIAAAYPPAGRQGNFDNSLPHLVFTRRTLLWERSLTGEPPPVPKAGQTDPDVPSWLALLVFHDSDPAPRLTTGSIADLVPTAKKGTLPGGTASYPALAQGTAGLDYGEKLTDPIQYIDVPAPLFQAIAPTAAELKLLAHARTVDQTAKAEEQLDGRPIKDYAVLVANRLPGRSTPDAPLVTHVHLVTLEGMAAFLPGGTGLTAQTLRLVSLYNWRFTSRRLPETFRDYLLDLDQGKGNQGNDGMIGLAAPPAPSSDAEKTVANALRWGYVPLEHRTRNGETTVSWYRGPLAPNATPVTLRLPKQHADALLRYDPDHGLFDVSYAAAWELGRLMALRDKSYARDLYKWKKQNKLGVIQAAEQALMKQRWGPAVPDAVGDVEAFRKTAMRHLMTNHLAKLT